MNRFFKSSICGAFIAVTLMTPATAWPAAKNNPPIIERIEFHDIPMAEALRLLSDQYRLNVITSKKAADVRVTMFLNKVTPEDVLETLAKTYNLWYRKDANSNIYRMYTAEEFRLGNVEANREHVKVFTARYQNVLSIAYAVQNLYPERVQMALGQEQDEIYQDLQNRFRRFDLLANRSTIDTGTNNGGGNNNLNNNSNFNNQNNNNQNNNNRNNRGNRSGRGNFQANNRGNVLSLLSNEELQKNLQDVISGNIQASTGQISQHIQEDAPIFLTLLKNQNNILVRTRDPMAIREIEKLIGNLDKPPITVLLEVKILSVALNDDYSSTFEFSIGDDNINITESSDPNFTSIANNATDLVRGALGDPSIVAGYLSKNLTARLKLLEDEGRITELATPVVSTANQEVSRITLAEERPITVDFNVSTSNTTATGSGTVVNQIRNDPVVERQQIGTTLIMTPSISKDNSVNLNLLIDQSAISPVQSEIPVDTGSGTIQNVPVDVVSRKSFAGNIVIQNNMPVAIGGLITERASDAEKKVPVLGDIPVLGMLFTDELRERKREELIIIIQPHIMSNGEKDFKFSKDFLDRNSVHPYTKNQDNLDIYSNDGGVHKDYKLEQPYKEYRFQDKQDSHRWNSPEQERKKQRKADKRKNAAQQTYIELTKYASKAVRLPAHEREQVSGIRPTELARKNDVDLLKINNGSLRAVPVASWKKGGVHVTALEVHNISSSPVKVDHRKLNGRWLASTIEDTTLAPDRQFGDSTYLYLVSAQPFWDIIDKAGQ
ncbi:DUF3438 family protein [Methylomarinum vadi]|uniref:DUF3438 family protein n=1 Tax=Methylomarinum vadi TaxID=438855 RepID=UPI0004DECE07|nr:DUF3438 family protein [Methylomarinum vadi]